MSRQRGSRTRVATGIYQDAIGYAVQVCVRGQRRERRFALGTSLSTLTEAREDLRAHLRRQARKAGPSGRQAATRGTFAADAGIYLAAVRRMPTYADRARFIGYWCEVFGTRARDTITAAQIRAQLADWQLERNWSPATCNHARTALMHLWHVLDGRSGVNPVRDVPRLEKPTEPPRALPLRAVARLIRRVHHHQERSVLWLMLATGVTPTEIARLDGRAVRNGHLHVQGRRKGKGSRPRILPLSRHGRAACRSMSRTGAWGSAVTLDTLNTAWRRVRRQAGEEAAGWRVYDLRHTYLTEMARLSGDERAIQYLAGHSSIVTTRLYTEGSVPDRVAALARLVD